MTIERISSPPPVASIGLTAGVGGAAATAHQTMGIVGERVLAWTAATSGSASAAGQWSSATGVAGNGFVPSLAELGRGGDVYGLRLLTAEVAAGSGATPAQEGALGRAIEDFTRGLALHFNGRAGGGEMVRDVAAAVDRAVSSGSVGGLDGVTSRIEAAAHMVDALNR